MSLGRDAACLCVRVALLAALGSCGAAAAERAPAEPGRPSAPVSDDAAEAQDAAARVLDDWHDAAAHGDLDRYFGHMSDDAVFLGTDATERWTKTEFREYATPHFEDGEAWVFEARRRDVVAGPSGRVVWFDEDLVTEGLGPARGSGVLRRGEGGRYRIAHYNLALTVPNERFPEVKQVLEAGQCGCLTGRVVVCGHRGRGGTREGNPLPENTLESMRAAVREGAEMVELDVQLSSDGVPVVFHDATLERTTDGRGCVHGKSLEQLRALDLGDGARIPTLKQVFDEIEVGINVELKINLEAKCPTQDVEHLVEAVSAVIESDRRERPVVVSSFHIETLQAMRSLSPKLDLAFITREEESIETALGARMSGVHPQHELVTGERLQRWREAGLQVRPWTVNDPAEMRRLLDLGVDAVITDEPAVLRDIRRRMCAAQC